MIRRKTAKYILRIVPFISLQALLLAGLLSAQSTILQVKHLKSIREHLQAPLRIAISPLGTVFVTNAVGDHISKYDSTGRFLEEIKIDGAPLAIVAKSDFLLYFGDRHSGDLLFLDLNSQVLKKVSGGTARFSLPASAALDTENRLLVVDGKEKSVRMFNTLNEEIGAFGEDKLGYPTAIAYDEKNQRILVAEHGGLDFGGSAFVDLIQVFDKDGIWLTSFGPFGVSDGQFTRIQGVAVDQSGRIYLVDPFQGIVTILNDKGELLAIFGEYGAETRQLRAPMDAAVDPHGRLWVTSMNNNSIEVFEITDVTTAVAASPESAVPTTSELLQNYPNPFNPGTWISFIIDDDSFVAIHIYNEVGKRIRTFDLGKRARGNYTAGNGALYWDGTNNRGERVASGIYFYEIRTDGFYAVRRMLLVK